MGKVRVERLENQNMLNVPNASILYTWKLVPWLVTFLKQTEQGYLGGPGFGYTSPDMAISRSSRSKSGPVVSIKNLDRLYDGHGWMS